MNKELISLITSLKNLNTLNIEDKLTYLHRYTHINISSRNFLSKTLKEDTFSNEVNSFINFLLSLEDFFIVSSINNQIAFKIIKKDFSLYTEIAISINTPNVRSFGSCKYNLEIFFLISNKKKSHIGSDFINTFIIFQNSIHIPIVIYCSKDLISYYEKFDFKMIHSNSSDEYLMIYDLTK